MLYQPLSRRQRTTFSIMCVLLKLKILKYVTCFITEATLILEHYFNNAPTHTKTKKILLS